MSGLDHSHGLSQWFASIKTDDIDGGLAADFDGSLSGLGVELGSSTYNMSEALLALPVFKMESVDMGFQYVLAAATSPATKMYEETLTYLNQGQPYEIKLKKLGENVKSQELVSTVRVLFHERRLQYMEHEQIESWRQNRPGERILDVDVPLSYGLLDIRTDKSRLNCIEFSWDPSKDSGIYIRVNCISTEFTAKKHGGEKGVPFRVQVETYARESNGSPKLVHCASCQVKVFKPKGADRKHKTDRERIEKRSETEKGKYQPSYDCTVLTEIPLEQVRTYLEHLKKASEAPSSSSGDQATPPPVPSPKRSGSVVAGSPSNAESRGAASFINDLDEDDDGGINIIIPPSNAGSSTPSATPESSTGFPRIESLERKEADQSSSNLTSQATAQQVTQWLHAQRFSNYVRTFQNFSGADLLRLSREDLIQICGMADGIRLNNALQSRSIRPRLTVYVYQQSSNSAVRQPLHQPPSPSGSLVTSMSVSSLSDDSMPPTPPPRPQITAPRGRQQPPTPPPLPLSSSRPSTNGRPTKEIVASDRKAKRTYTDYDASEDVAYSKKQRTRTLELHPKSVYHAVFLEMLTLGHLKEKLAALFSVSSAQVSQVFVQAEAGMLILVTDDVVENFHDETKFSIEGMQEDDRPGFFYIVLKSDA